MKKRWYIQTWFISLLFIFWFLVVPGILGIVFLVIQVLENKKNILKYGEIDSLDDKIFTKTEQILSLDTEFKEKQHRLGNEYFDNRKKLDQEINNLKVECENAKNKLQIELNYMQAELDALLIETFIVHFDFSEYDDLTSQECLNKMTLLKIEEQKLLKDGLAISASSSSDKSKKEINNNIKQLLRCFNAECDNIVSSISIKTIDSTRSKIAKSFDTLNTLFNTNHVYLNKELLELKLEELNLTYAHRLKKEQEKEQQRTIKEQMVEEEKVRREIEREKAKISKDKLQVSNEVNKLITYLQNTQNDIEKQLYLDKIRELEEKLKSLDDDEKNVLEREANARAGFVYIISNIGSFGENIYKIGMTRRLEPMDRVKELSSASVPFGFDVHAMIFSDDAPLLENTLHHHFRSQSVNKINFRKEFFKVSLDDIEKITKEKYNNTVEFVKVPLAKEYRQSLVL